MEFESIDQAKGRIGLCNAGVRLKNRIRHSQLKQLVPLGFYLGTFASADASSKRMSSKPAR